MDDATWRAPFAGPCCEDATHFYVLESGTAMIRVRPRDDSGHPIMDDPDQLVGEYKSGGDHSNNTSPISVHRLTC